MAITKEQIIAFVRRDGPTTAPVVFLTIEDGAGFRDRAEFDSYHADVSQQAWEPREPSSGVKFGKPGIFIPKLMLAMLGRDINQWQNYRDNRLYIEGTCNIKYYPIARRGTNDWYDFFSGPNDFTRDEYLARCCGPERRDAILAAHGDAFTREKLIVILGACGEWRAFLDSTVFAGEDMRSVERVVAENGSALGELFGTPQGEFRYCYFDMFRYGIRDEEVIQFAERVRARAGNLLAKVPGAASPL